MESLIIDRVVAKLSEQGIKNLLGSARENLKLLVPLVLAEMKQDEELTKTLREELSKLPYYKADRHNRERAVQALSKALRR